MDTKQKIQMAEKRITELQILINYWNRSQSNAPNTTLKTIKSFEPKSSQYEAA